MSILFRRCCSPPAPWQPSCSCRPRPPPASPPGPAGWSWEGRRWGPSTPARIYTSEVGNLIFDRNYLGIAWGHSSEYCLLIITWLWTLEMGKVFRDLWPQQSAWECLPPPGRGWRGRRRLRDSTRRRQGRVVSVCWKSELQDFCWKHSSAFVWSPGELSPVDLR